MKRMVSYITVCRNAVNTIASTFDSILTFGGTDCECVVVDGGSTDGTRELIASYADKFDGRMKWISEPDKGIYDAMNKGLGLASGEWISFQNDGDRLLKTPYDALREAIGRYDIVAFSVDSEGGVIKPRKGITLHFRNTLPHQGLFYKRECLLSVNGYNLEYKILSDYDLNLRLIRKGAKTLIRTNEVVAFHSVNGISSIGGRPLRREMRKVVCDNFGMLMMCVAFFEHKFFGFRQFCSAKLSKRRFVMRERIVRRRQDTGISTLSRVEKMRRVYDVLMFKLSRVGGPILRIVGMGHPIYLKEKWGDEFPETTFLILRRGDNCGLCSYITTVVGGCKYAMRRGYVPVVDMMTERNIYLTESEVGKVNAWEYFFEQPHNFTLEDIRHAKNVIVAKHWDWREMPKMSIDYFLDRNGALTKDRDFVRKYLRLKPRVKSMVAEASERLFKGHAEKFLGVFLRGTDFVRMKPYSHAVQPSVEVVADDIRQCVRRHKFEKIFVVTEDRNILRRLIAEFPALVCYVDQCLINYRDGYIGDNIMHQAQDESFCEKKGLDYLVAVKLLSLCGAVLASRSNGSLVAALFANENQAAKYYDLGEYGLFEARKM